MSHSPPSSPFQRYRMSDAAKDNRLIVCRCTQCLHDLLPRERSSEDKGWCVDPHVPPFECSRCGRADYIHVALKIALVGDYGHIIVRRPGPVRRTQTWYNEKLGGSGYG